MPDLMRKCGVICTMLPPERREYVFSCVFCDCIFSRVNNFILHIEDKHQSSIKTSEPLLDATLKKLVVVPPKRRKYEISRKLSKRRPNSKSYISEKSAAESSPQNFVEFEHMIVDIKKDIAESECSYNQNGEGTNDTECGTNRFHGYKSAELINEAFPEDEIDAGNLMEEKLESDIETYEYDRPVTIKEENEDISENECGGSQSNEDVNVDCTTKLFQPNNLLETYGKNMLLTILSVCEKHPILWDKTAPHANNTWFREKAYKSIADAVGKPNEWKVVRDIILRLRVRIHNQMQMKQLAEKNDKPYTPLWENDIVAFLKPTPKKKKKKSQEKKENKMEEEWPTFVKKEKALITKNSDYNDDESNEIKSNSNDNNAGESNYECAETESDSEHPISPMATYGKETLIAIFTSYTHHDLLWDVNDSMFKNEKLRQKAYMSIASDVGKSSEWRTIREILQRARIRLLKEIQKKKLAQLQNEPFIPKWEQDMISFLKPKKLKTYIPISKKLRLPNSKLSDLQCLEFIEIYKSFNCLWDEQDITYRFKNRRQEAMTCIQEMLKSKVGLSLTQTELEREIVRIRKMCSQEKNHKLNCERSNSIYKPDCKYYDKIAFLEVDVGPFQCSVCGDVSDSPTQFKIHKSTHDGSMPFNCIICKQSFSQIGNMTVHLRRHVRDYVFECDVCKKRFAASTDLIVHKRGHTGEKPYFCDICGQSFIAWCRFNNHVRHHQNLRSHKCEVCSKTFFNKCVLLTHMGTHSTVRDQICNVCGKGFTTKSRLRQHKLIHGSKKKYVCRICGKQFAQCAGLSGHMKTHGSAL